MGESALRRRMTCGNAAMSTQRQECASHRHLTSHPGAPMRARATALAVLAMAILTACSGTEAATTAPTPAASSPPSKSALNNAACVQLNNALQPIIALKKMDPAALPQMLAKFELDDIAPIGAIAGTAEGSVKNAMLQVASAVDALVAKVKDGYPTANATTELESLTLTIAKADMLCQAEGIMLSGELT